MGSRIEIKNWSYRYPLNDAWAVEDLTLNVAAGEKVLLTGRSGWGKSTVLQAIAGILGSADEGGESSGSITIDGTPALEARGRVGLILQNPESQVIFARVQDNATFGGENLGVEREEILTRTEEALHTVDLDAEHGISPQRLAQHLSGGQTQRLAIASIMVMRPDVIICDEPTANLDPDGVQCVVDAIADAAHQTGATLLVVDHNVQAWDGIVERHIALGDQVDFEDYAGRYASTRPHGPKALEAQNLSFGYAGEPLSYPLTTHFHTHEVTAITGVNGAGKTTLSLTLAGLLPALAGEVRVSDAIRADLPSAHPSDWDSHQLAERIQYVFQNPEHQFVTNTVLGEMESALRISHPELAKDEEKLAYKAKERLAYYDLAEQQAQNPYSLSGGQKRRLTVACAIEAKPNILLVDEPTYGQDPHTWLTLVKMFAKLRDEGTCVITVTHDRAFIDALGARELVIPARTYDENHEDKDTRVDSPSRIVARLNPLSRFFTGLLVGLPLIISLDVVSASVALGAILVVLLALGFSPKKLALYTWPMLIGAAGSFLTVIIHNAQHDPVLASATAIRVLAMSAPAVVLVMGIDPTDLADAFVQKLHLSDRFVYAALAGFRLLPLLKEDLECIHQARTIRGLHTRSKFRQLFSDALSILILAVRRSTTLSLVMQARGFGADVQRTLVRISRTSALDAVAYALAVAIPLLSLGVAYYSGSMNLFGNLI
ncbi:hypothetical protein B9G54_05695 [Alloscardovia macacae]|uniref:ABC transporter domain-containing protein n=1 Tax=Alloscardovia macacae TaxID=1160091 RepID=A0A1Y2SVV3_9BIFI|nr:ATP-binding cassette domain-containing protein [Alloscardovia macacae]OTA26175.1 hypothetical protein B9G54_05695 [Alloscardovia macacae]OTA29974.1 hypothetical protein B9T39_00995 [Alloscardovia macacae]